MKTATQLYNAVITDIALNRNGIKAKSKNKLTKKNWDVLIANANGDSQLAQLAVDGYFDSAGSDYVEEAGYGE